MQSVSIDKCMIQCVLSVSLIACVHLLYIKSDIKKAIDYSIELLIFFRQNLYNNNNVIFTKSIMNFFRYPKASCSKMKIKLTT